MMEIVPATHDLLVEYYGGAPPYSVHAKIALRDGKPIGVGGIQFILGCAFAFAEMKGELSLKERARCVRAVEEILNAHTEPVYCIAETYAGPLLMKLGFEADGRTARVPLITGGELAGTLMVRDVQA